MPMPCYMTVKGKTQGNIDGSCTIKGHEKTIFVYELDHSVGIPTDPGSGLPTGKRIHYPLVVTKEIDKSSPKLQQALVSGELLTEVLLEFWHISPAGKEEKYYTIKLENAIVVKSEDYFPLTFLEESKPYRHMEKISFTYGKIIWTWVPDGIESEDSWEAPK
ncbi:MAG: Hcp family type VI secretion system effector [Desulfobacteraceae bacterium]|nr:MAG: Hcp family type VI secretion system effector [Desulfobacteraceae bacterium]